MVEEDPLLYEEDCICEITSRPVPLSQEDSSRLFFQSQRIKHHLENLLGNTKDEKVVGELVLAVAMASKNKESHQLSESARDP
jgi:hypothetical protein